MPWSVFIQFQSAADDSHERDLKRYAQARRAFSAPRYRVLYRAWLREGARVIDATSSPALADAITRGAGRFEAHVLAHPYLHLSSLVGRHELSSWGDTPGDKRLGGCCLPVVAGAVDGPRTSQDQEPSREAREATRAQWFGDGASARGILEIGRRLVPPPPPTNRPPMRESGRERPPSPTRETGFRAATEGRSRPACQCRSLTRGGPHRAGSGGTSASLVQGFAANPRSGKQATTHSAHRRPSPGRPQRPPRSCESARAFLQQAPQRRDRSRSNEPDHHAGDGGLALVPVKAPRWRSAHARGVASALTGASTEPKTGSCVMVRTGPDLAPTSAASHGRPGGRPLRARSHSGADSDRPMPRATGRRSAGTVRRGRRRDPSSRARHGAPVGRDLPAAAGRPPRLSR